MKVNEIAAYIHKRMCDDDRFGYSWEERYGYSREVWSIDGKDYVVYVGDYDCSSSSITAWKVALQHTAFADSLDGATYTGNMRRVFVNSGLFEWKPMSFLAETGDLYLNETNHVAMCQTQYPDVLSEFSWGDNGAYGNQRGDQSGWEAHVCGYYDYPWDGILHYNDKADGTSGSGSSAEWQGDVVGREDTTDAGDDYAGVFGRPMLYLAIEGAGEYQVHDLNGGWWPCVDHYDLSDEEYGMAGAGTPIDAVRISDPLVLYQTHNLGGSWNEVMRGTLDTGGSGDDFAGEYGVAQDAIRIWREGGTQPRYNVFS